MYENIQKLYFNYMFRIHLTFTNTY